MYKCCRWCTHFSNGACLSGQFSNGIELDMNQIRDDGLILEVLKETMNFTDDNLKDYYALAKELKISKVKADKLVNILNEALENKKYDIEDSIDTVLMNNLMSAERVYIDNEHEFVCSEFR